MKSLKFKKTYLNFGMESVYYSHSLFFIHRLGTLGRDFLMISLIVKSEERISKRSNSSSGIVFSSSGSGSLTGSASHLPCDSHLLRGTISESIE